MHWNGNAESLNWPQIWPAFLPVSLLLVSLLFQLTVLLAREPFQFLVSGLSCSCLGPLSVMLPFFTNHPELGPLALGNSFCKNHLNWVRYPCTHSSLSSSVIVLIFCNLFVLSVLPPLNCLFQEPCPYFSVVYIHLLTDCPPHARHAMTAFQMHEEISRRMITGDG